MDVWQLPHIRHTDIESGSALQAFLTYLRSLYLSSWGITRE
jgi:hypothetical protein